MVTEWLIYSMAPFIGKTYLFLLIVKDIWQAIYETYSDGENSSHIFELKTQLYTPFQLSKF